MYIFDSSSNSCHQQFTTKKEEGPIVPPCTILPLPNSSCLSLQQELNSTSDAMEKFLVQLSSPSDYHPLLTNVFFQSPQKLSVPSNLSFPSFSSTIVSFVQKLQPFSRAKPPFSIIASPTLAIIRSRHTGSIPIQSSRHANLSVHHLCPNSTKLPMRK
jgi:hypothetical protein